MRLKPKLLSSFAAVVSLIATFFVSSPAVASPALVISNPSGTYSAHVSTLLPFQLQSTDIFDLSSLKFLVSGDVDRVDVQGMNSGTFTWSTVQVEQVLSDGSEALVPTLANTSGFRIRANSEFAGVVDLFAWLDVDGDGLPGSGEVISEARTFSFFDSSLSGILLDSVSGEPVPNERLYAYPLSGSGNWGWATSDSEGQFELRVDGIGQYQLNYDFGSSGNIGKDNGAVRYLPRTEVVTIGEAATLGFEWKLNKYPVGTSTLLGVVDQQLLSSNVNLTLNCWAGGQHLFYNKSVSSSDGAFAFLKIPNMSCGLHASANGYIGRNFDIDLSAPNALVAKSIELEPNGTSTVSGFVTNASTGEPVSGLVVGASYENQGSSWGSSDTTDLNGYYEIQNVPTGTVQIRVHGRNESPRYRWGSDQRFSVSSANSNINLNLLTYPSPSGAGQITGQIRDSQGRPVAGAQVHLDGNVDGEWFSTTAQSENETGQFILSDLPFATYNLRVSAPNSLNFRRSVTLSSDSPTLAISPQMQDLGSGTLSGKVSDTETGLALANAQVGVGFSTDNSEWWGYSQTDSNGNYSIDNVPEGVVSVSAWPASGGGQYFYFNPVKVAVRGETTLDLGLEPFPTGTRQFDLTLAGLSSGIESSVYLNCTYGERNIHYSAETIQGVATFSNLASLNCSYGANADGYFTIRGQADLRNSNQMASRSMTARGSSTLSGVVVSEGDPDIKVAGANVHVYVESADYSWGASVQTDTNGEFTIANVPDAAINVSVGAPEGTPRYFGSQTQRVQVNGDTSGVVVQLKPMASGPGSIEGTINSQSGDPIAEAFVSSYISISDDEYLYVSARTDDSGKYRITDLPSGTYTLNVSAQGYLNRSSRVTVADTASGSRISLTPEGTDTISGRLVSSADSSVGLPNAYVNAEFSMGDTNWESSVTTGPDGEFEIRKVPRGEIAVRVGNIPDGYFGPDWQTIDVAGDVELTLVADPHPTGTSSLLVNVAEWDPNNPVGTSLSDVSVDLICYHPRGQISQSLSTDTQGQVIFENVLWPSPASGSCEIGASKDGYSSSWDWFDRSFPNSKSFQLIENGDEVITARVLDPEGSPLPNTYLSLVWKNGEKQRSWSEQTDPNGVVTFDSAMQFEQGGEYTLILFHWGLPDDQWYIAPAPIEFSNNGSEDFEIQLGRLERGPATISGRLLDASSRQPISDSKVLTSFHLEINGIFQEFSVEVDVGSDGTYSLGGLYPEQMYGVRAFSPDGDFNEVNRGVWIGPNQNSRTVDIYAEIIDASSEGFGLVSGYIVDDYGFGVPGISVEINSYKPGDYWNDIARSSTDGYFEFTEVPFGQVNIWIDSPMASNGRPIYKRESLSYTQFRLDSSRTSRTGLDFELVEYPLGNGSISGRLVDRDSQASPNTSFSVKVTGDESIFPSWSNANVNQDGAWSIAQLPDGEFTISFESGDYSSGSVTVFPEPITVLVENGQAVNTGTQNSYLLGDYGSSLKVVVVDQETKEPIPEASVWITHETATQFRRSQDASTNGVAEFTGIPLGKYVVAATAEGYAPLANISVVDVGESDKVFRYELRPMNKTGTVFGTVKDRFGNPIPDATIMALWEITYGFEGGGEGVEGSSDEDGNFVIRNVPLWKGLKLNASIWDSGRLEEFAPFTTEFDLSTESPQAEFDIVLFEPAILKGQVIRPDGTSSIPIKALVLDALSGEILSESPVSQDGAFELEEVPAVPVKIQIRTGDTTASRTISTSYYKQTSSIAAIGVSLAGDADTLTPAPGQLYELEPMQLTVGNSITGLVRYLAGDQESSNLPRQVRVEVFSWNGGDWELRDDLQSTTTSNFQGGRYTIAGLPDGRYTLRFKEAYPTTNPLSETFLGGSQTAQNAIQVELIGAQKVSVQNALVSIPQPTFSVAPVSVGSMTSAQRGALAGLVVPIATSSSAVELNLGLEMAGEWVAVSIEASTVTSQSLFGALAFVSQSVLWYQVGANGMLTVPVTTTGAKNVVVQDSQGQPIGWTSVTIAETSLGPSVGSGSGGGGGGGGGGAAPLAAPVQIKPGYVSGTHEVGKTLTANVGEWEQQGTTAFTYQWHRCRSELVEPAASDVTLTCSSIFGATASQYLVTEADKGLFLLAEVRAKDSTGVLIGEALTFTNTLKFGETGKASSGAVVATDDGKQKTWAKRLPSNLEAKLYAKNIIGAGKVTFKVNGKEIAWVNAKDLNDKKLRVITEGPMTGASYLVRTIKLQKGKNVLEVYVDGVRTTRVSYSR